MSHEAMCDTSDTRTGLNDLDGVTDVRGNVDASGSADAAGSADTQLLPFEDDIDQMFSDSDNGNVTVKMTVNLNDSTGFVLTTTTTTTCTTTKSSSNYLTSPGSTPTSEVVRGESSDGDSQSVIINGKVVDLRSERYAVLTYEQVDRLDQVMDQVWPIHGRGNFPTLEVRLKDLVQVVRSKLESDNVLVRDIRLNGGAASHVLAPENSAYNDLDLIFGVDLSNNKNYDRVRAAVLDALMEFLPDSSNKKRMSSCSLKEGYVHKMVKVNDGDRWSLISLSNSRGRNVELKFVDVMRRQFEFSVDSFQIILDSLLQFYECSTRSHTKISENFYPTVVGESVYGDFREALYHLQKKLIATRNPEEIRGGGLLKYCNLLVRNYQPNKPDQIKTLERYMCSRFFIDFSDLSQQRAKLENYLENHFAGEEHMKYHYLVRLSNVVNNSTVCLMGHERRQTLNLIDELAYYQQYQDQQRSYLAKHQFDVPYIYGNGSCYYYTPYLTTTHQQTSTCYTPCHCGQGWMTCMTA